MSSPILSDRRILEEKQENHVIIEPYSESQLNNCSYNVTLSEYFFREKRNPFVKEVFFNPWIEEQVAERWEPGVVNVANEWDANKLGLKVGEKYIPLAPLETILVATQEFIGGREHITTMIKGRSSAGRAFLSVCGGAGWGDVGYVNRWTLMVTNLSRFANVILPVGCSIAQIIFLECGYPNKSYGGKYQSDIGPNKDINSFLTELKEKWSPAMMLPQLYREIPNDIEKGILPSEEIKETVPLEEVIIDIESSSE